VIKLFNIKQSKQESIKEYFNRFSKEALGIHPPNEEMFTDIFVKGLWANYFSKSLIRNKVDNLVEIKKSSIIKGLIP